MVAARTLSLLLAASVAVSLVSGAVPNHVRVRRQLADDNSLQPIDDSEGEQQTRDKRKFEAVAQSKFGIKNAILGLVFGGINSLIDAKTRLVDNLDKKNIEINKQYGIETPQNGVGGLVGAIGQAIQPKLQLIGPKIQTVTSLLGGASGASSGQGGGASGGVGSFVNLLTSLAGSSSGSSSGGANAGGTVETVDSSEEDSS
ncbi:uncharacterized protein LOC113520406 [Galleria mellonella]|uniref:Uncharacterized protein LOC113520406 n=1 Tax=Galleria mellonella TaxID=7137 RepID=A0A6J1WXY3_GALME|nr:uncharacterized protein LOC113520406 [Galleria mellonella]